MSNDLKFLEFCEKHVNDHIDPNSPALVKKKFLESLEEGTFYLAKILLKHLETLNYGSSHDNEDINPLIRMAHLGKLDAVKFLVDNGADINFRSVNSTTAIMYAFEKGHVDIVKYLIEKEAITKHEKAKITDFPIHITSEKRTEIDNINNKYLDLIDYLLKRISELEKVDSFNKW